MAQPYLEKLKTLIEQLRNSGCDTASIDCKHFFSGAAAYHNGSIFMSLSPVGLGLKLSSSDCEQLFVQGAQSLRYFPSAPVKKGYAVLTSEMVGDLEVLVPWVKKSIEFVEQPN